MRKFSIFIHHSHLKHEAVQKSVSKGIINNNNTFDIWKDVKDKNDRD